MYFKPAPTPPFDTELQKAIKKTEDETGLKAPLFGADTLHAASSGKHWAAVGKAWRGRAGKTAYTAYRKQFPDNDNAYAARYDDAEVTAVLRGDHDELLKRAVARCHMKGLDIWKDGYKFVALKVGYKSINERLKALDATQQKNIWRSELRTKMDALEEEFGGQTFFDDEKVQNVVVAIGFREGEDIYDPDPWLMCRFSTEGEEAELEPRLTDWVYFSQD